MIIKTLEKEVKDKSQQGGANIKCGCCDCAKDGYRFSEEIDGEKCTKS